MYQKTLKYSMVCALFILFAISLTAQTNITVDKTRFHFGMINEGENAPVSFTLQNHSSEPVRITEVRTFAACVQSVPVKKKVIEPGESLELNYVFESLGYGGINVNKQIEIYFENKKEPLKLHVTGTVQPLRDFQAPVGEMSYNFFVLIDIRSRTSFTEAHIVGAIHVPADRMLTWFNQIKANLSDEVVIYLISEDGKASDKIADQLNQQGYQQFFSIVGGMREWKHQKGQHLLISGNH